MRDICGEHELYTSPDTKVSTTKDHGKNYIKVRPPLVRHITWLCYITSNSKVRRVYSLRSDAVQLRVQSQIQ